MLGDLIIIENAFVWNLLHKWRADVICFEETKHKFVNQAIIVYGVVILGMGWYSFGGILVVWDRRVVDLVDYYVGEFFVAYHLGVW